MGKKKQDEKKQEVKKFLRCKLEKTEDGVKLLGIYEVEVEKEVEKQGKKVKETEKVEIEELEEEIKISELDQRIKEKLEIYGLYVKVQRAAAGLKSEEKKLETWKQIIKSLKNGEWERKTDNTKLIEKAKLDLINSISDPKLRKKIKKELGLA